MRVRGRGFALMLVLIAVAAVFALSMQAAVTARAARAETMVLHDRARHLPGARAAAAMVIQGMSMPSTEVDGVGFDGGSSGGLSGGGDDEPEDDIDLEFVLELMPPEERAEFLRQLEEARKKRDPEVDALGDGGGFAGGVRGGSTLKTIQRFGLPGGAVGVDVRGERYEVWVRDAGGLLNINSADEKRIETYFYECGAPRQTARRIAHQITDWRDADDFKHELGAESSDYKRLGVRPRNGSIITLEELLYLPAMTDELFERARSGLCVSGDGKIHAGSAPREVLMTIPGMTANSAEVIIVARSRGVVTEQQLSSLLPLGGDAGSFIRADPTNIFAIEVRSVSDASVVFEGVAMVGDRGVEQLGLKPR